MSIATALRQRQTPLEGRLWARLRNRGFFGYKFRRQHPVGRWVVDFACLERRLIVELDGAMHALRSEIDQRRDEELHSQGFLVLRIHNAHLREYWDECLERILMALQREID